MRANAVGRETARPDGRRRSRGARESDETAASNTQTPPSATMSLRSLCALARLTSSGRGGAALRGAATSAPPPEPPAPRRPPQFIVDAQRRAEAELAKLGKAAEDEKELPPAVAGEHGGPKGKEPTRCVCVRSLRTPARERGGRRLAANACRLQNSRRSSSALGTGSATGAVATSRGGVIGVAARRRHRAASPAGAEATSRRALGRRAS